MNLQQRKYLFYWSAKNKKYINSGPKIADIPCDTLSMEIFASSARSLQISWVHDHKSVPL